MKTKIIHILLINIISLIYANAQSKKIDDFLILDTIIYFDKINSSMGLIYGNIPNCIDGNILYLTNYNFVNNKNNGHIINVITINTDTKKIDSLKFNIPNNIKFLHSQYSKIWSFSVNYPYINFYIDNKYIIFEFDTNNNTTNYLYYWQDFSIGGNYISIMNRKYIIESKVDYKSYQPIIKLYLIKKNKNVLREMKPDFEMAEFSHIAPNNWVHKNASGDRFLISQTIKYKIEIFDTLFNVKSLIKKNDPEWVVMPDKFRKNINKYAHCNRFEEMMYLDTLYSRIQSAWFIGDSTILVQYVNPQPYDPYYGKLIYDVWKLNKYGEWEILHDAIIDKYPEKNFTINKETYPFISQENTNFIFTQNKLIVITSSDNINPIGLTWKEYKKETKKWYEDNSAILKIAIFSYSF